MAVLVANSLTKVYGGGGNGNEVRALNGVNLTIEAGEFVAIMGPSGSGKTTLLNILAGLDHASTGTLDLDGQAVHTLSGDDMALFRRRKLGFVFQDFNLLDTLTLAENVALPLALDGADRKTVRVQVETVMHQLGLGESMHRYPYEVSGGQQQRAAVARAIVHKPALVLADEPTGNLDSASARALLELFTKLHQERHATLLMVTHDPLAASYSNRIVFIKDGQVYSRLEREGRREAFFQEILQTLSVLEGHGHDLGPAHS
ncbi:ABC transporter ATP-binding protein [Alicyclobacillus dauci]|uniref:ABC transporter ATP-binding protein n=1 Tax=Alicyclobacillus dauci TaxID=1475485 RepID=A0ABY6Z6Q6_9BACL|nr:ABC transporter ATP-binding protein [Alicyclobacillus dauci]WAH37715.1 ABC transporter ATP-binding protein [Alicyclobacillus dauci]